MGQLVVVLFLFLSGYGVVSSVERKGDDYLKKFPKDRILKTWLHFAIIVAIYWILQVALGNRYDIITIVMSMFAFENLGNSNWYIFAILYLYIASYVGFFISKKAMKKNLFIPVGIVIVAILTVLYMGVFRYVLQYNTVWYDSVICYVVGMIYYALEERIIQLLQSKRMIYCAVCLAVLLLFVGNYFVFWHLKEYNYLFYFWIQAFALIALILLISMKVIFHSRIMSWCGENLFYIYILQRIPFILLDRISVNNLYVYFMLAIVGTVLLTILVKKAFDKMDKVLFQSKTT